MFVAGWRHALRSEWPFIIIKCHGHSMHVHVWDPLTWPGLPHSVSQEYVHGTRSVEIQLNPILSVE